VYFRFDPRLGIDVPSHDLEFEHLSPSEQETVLLHWEGVRAHIPDRILEYEHHIEDLLAKVHQEEDWDTIAALFVEISDYASRINELNTWRRIDLSLPSAVADHPAVHEHRDREK
jgi:hypothetical protein